MSPTVYLKLAFKALWSNKTRTFLSVLGVVIGISSVIILMSVGAGAQNYILDKVKSFGSNIIIIFPGTPEEEGFSAPASFAGIIITTLTFDDTKALINPTLAPHISSSTATVSSQVVATSPYNEKLTQMTGTTPSYFSIRNTKIVSGNTFEDRDVDGLARVAIIGPTTKKDLFPNSDAIGESIKINNFSFKIIGITESKGIGQFGADYDKMIYIPLTTAQKLLMGIDYVSAITVAATNDQSTTLANMEAKNILLDRHKIEAGDKPDFIINDSKEALKTINNITNALAMFLAALAAISLLVGGIGIMNIMLVSVTERTKEIGLRKAIGAKRMDILSQFLIEALAITLLGGVIGILIGYSVSFLVSTYSPLKTEVTSTSVIMALTVSTLSGIIFGLYPADQASKLDPIQALRFQ